MSFGPTGSLPIASAPWFVTPPPPGNHILIEGLPDSFALFGLPDDFKIVGQVDRFILRGLP